MIKPASFRHPVRDTERRFFHEQIQASPARRRQAMEPAADSTRCEDALQPSAERGQRHGLHRAGGAAGFKRERRRGLRGALCHPRAEAAGQHRQGQPEQRSLRDQFPPHISEIRA